MKWNFVWIHKSVSQSFLANLFVTHDRFPRLVLITCPNLREKIGTLATKLGLLTPLNPNKYDDFHIYMDYVTLYIFTEGK